MDELIQNNALTFQTPNLKIIYNISGIFKWEDEAFQIIINDNIITIDNKQYIIYKNLNYIGGSFWISSIAMILFIQKYSEQFKNKSILELGAGIALPSIYLSNYSNNITVSDIDLNVCSNSIILNHVDTIIKTKYISWSNLDISDTDTYDIIIACDCIYRNTSESLLETIKKYSHNKTTLYLYNAIRNSDCDEFIYALQELYSNITYNIKYLYYNNLFYIKLFEIQNFL
jgi:hypothetical protein